ncbi:MAG: hypothetical protein AAB897_01425 [Patescibacteria group bacterium]
MLLMLVAAAVFAALWLVILYNSTVDLEHGIVSMRGDIKSLQAENAELKEGIYALFDAANFKKNVGSDLVQDKNPEYMEVGAGEKLSLGLRN